MQLHQVQHLKISRQLAQVSGDSATNASTVAAKAINGNMPNTGEQQASTEHHLHMEFLLLLLSFRYCRIDNPQFRL
jgi:hypothetical protein